MDIIQNQKHLKNKIMKKSKKQKKRDKKAKKRAEMHDNKPTDAISGDALDGHGSISSWEEANGRGFWGSSANGYVYDDDQKNW